MDEGESFTHHGRNLCGGVEVGEAALAMELALIETATKLVGDPDVEGRILKDAAEKYLIIQFQQAIENIKLGDEGEEV